MTTFIFWLAILILIILVWKMNGFKEEVEETKKDYFLLFVDEQGKVENGYLLSEENAINLKSALEMIICLMVFLDIYRKKELGILNT